MCLAAYLSHLRRMALPVILPPISPAISAHEYRRMNLNSNIFRVYGSAMFSIYFRRRSRSGLSFSISRLTRSRVSRRRGTASPILSLVPVPRGIPSRCTAFKSSMPCSSLSRCFCSCARLSIRASLFRSSRVMVSHRLYSDPSTPLL